MNRKIIAVFVISLFIAVPAVWGWSLFEDNSVEENTGHVSIKNIETEWAKYSEGYYGYNVEFEIYDLSTSHEILTVITFYDSNDDVIENDNLSGGIKKPISQGKVQNNLTIPLEEYEKSSMQWPSSVYGGIERFNYSEVDHIKIDLIDADENKVLYSVNETFNMSNIWKGDETSQPVKTDSKSDKDYEFFKETDLNGDNLIDFSEFSEISYIFTEDSYWDGYSIEEILESEWEQADSNGDDYLSFEEFKTAI